MNFPDMDHLAPGDDEQFMSLGFICGLFQIVPGQLRVIMEDAEIKFALVMDGIGYVRVKDAERIGAMVRDIRKDVHDTLDAAKNN